MMKSFTVLSLSTLMAFSAYANTQNNPKQPSTKTQQKQNTPTKPTPAATTEQQLKKFTKSISLKFGGVNLAQQNNQVFVNFNYELKNISKSSIKTVHWTTTYFYDGQPILIQDEPITFEKRFKPKATLPLTFSVPWENLPAVAQQAFSTPNAQLSSQFEAKQIIFWNGSKIEIK